MKKFLINFPEKLYHNWFYFCRCQYFILYLLVDCGHSRTCGKFNCTENVRICKIHSPNIWSMHQITSEIPFSFLSFSVAFVKITTKFTNSMNFWTNMCILFIRYLKSTFIIFRIFVLVYIFQDLILCIKHYIRSTIKFCILFQKFALYLSSMIK